jgi:hypothetical protein
MAEKQGQFNIRRCGGVYSPPFIMTKMGVTITLDIERNLVFNLNVLEKCVEKYGSMDDVLNLYSNLTDFKWLGIQMLNEEIEEWNDDHPDQQKPLLTEKQLGRMLDGVGGITEFQSKIREAMLKGLPVEKVAEVEELEKNLIAAQSGKMSQVLGRLRKHRK